MAAPTVPYITPQNYAKNLVVHFGCQVVPFYKIDEVATEGVCVGIDTTKVDTIKVITAGNNTNGEAIGLLAQEVYDASLLGELRNYEFHNNTKARTGDTVGMVTGQGYVLTKAYVGTVTQNASLYPDASGFLTTTQTSTDKVVGIAEEGGSNGDTLIRVRVDLTIA